MFAIHTTFGWLYAALAITNWRQDFDVFSELVYNIIHHLLHVDHVVPSLWPTCSFASRGGHCLSSFNTMTGNRNKVEQRVDLLGKENVTSKRLRRNKDKRSERSIKMESECVDSDSCAKHASSTCEYMLLL